jgi:uncharacterized paraquat-inducible protein A
MIDEKRLQEAHTYSSNHREAIERSQLCGCFSCLSAFSTGEIREWIDKGQTAICPRCGVDAVLGDAMGLSLDDEFMRAMEKEWFGLLWG